MKRQPSPKQRFIKDYARLIYGPDAKSNSLTSQDRAIIKHLFNIWPDHTELLAQYPAWITDNWTAIRSHLDNKQFRSDISAPGTYLFSNYFTHLFLFYVANGRKLKRR